MVTANNVASAAKGPVRKVRAGRCVFLLTVGLAAATLTTLIAALLGNAIAGQADLFESSALASFGWAFEGSWVLIAFAFAAEISLQASTALGKRPGSAAAKTLRVIAWGAPVAATLVQMGVLFAPMLVDALARQDEAYVSLSAMVLAYALVATVLLLTVLFKTKPLARTTFLALVGPSVFFIGDIVQAIIGIVGSLMMTILTLWTFSLVLRSIRP